MAENRHDCLAEIAFYTCTATGQNLRKGSPDTLYVVSATGIGRPGTPDWSKDYKQSTRFIYRVRRLITSFAAL